MISALPVSGAWHPNTMGAHDERPRISLSRASFSWPYPWPPSSGPRWVAHRPWRRTSSLSGSIASRRLPSSGMNCRCGNTRSSGSTSSRTNCVRPVQLLLVLRIGFEVPRHVRPSLGRDSEYDSEYQERNTILRRPTTWPAGSSADPGQARGPVRRRGPAPARCRARGHPPLRHVVPPPGGRHRRGGRALQRRLLPALPLEGRPGHGHLWRTAASACTATWPTRWTRSRRPRARCGAGSGASWPQADKDIAATTLAVLWNASALGGGPAAGATSPARRSPPSCTSRSRRWAAARPNSMPALAAHATLGMLSDCLWQQVQPTRAEVERVTSFCLGGVGLTRLTASAYANSSGTQLGARFSMKASIPSRARATPPGPRTSSGSRSGRSAR